MDGYVHSVETFGTVDGPGIRYVLFLSGCGLACSFCHNPDTWQKGTQTMSVKEVLADIRRYRKYYDKSGGGLTVSGGEPLLQADFITALFKACKAENIHTLIDTSGYCPQASLEKILSYTDYIQFSIKAVDVHKHKLLTGAVNDLILANLRLAALSTLPLIVRYVVIPGISDTAHDVKKLADLINSLPGSPKVELLAYHTLGVKKWEALGKTYTLSHIRPATPEDVKKVQAFLTSQGIELINAE